MKHYYITNRNSEKGFDEVSELEFYALVGTDETHDYINDLYCGAITLSDVPEELREEVQTVVNNRIARFGEYKDREITAEEFKDIVEEAL